MELTVERADARTWPEERLAELFSEALRQEVTGRRVRVGLVEPGMTTTEMAARAGSGAARGLPQQAWQHSDDVARCLTFVITQPPHAAVDESWCARDPGALTVTGPRHHPRIARDTVICCPIR